MQLSPSNLTQGLNQTRNENTNMKIRNNRARGLIAGVLVKHEVTIESLATHSGTSEESFIQWLTGEYDYIVAADIERVEQVIGRYMNER